MRIGLTHVGRGSTGIALIAIAGLLLPAASRAAEGDLDQSFGSGGKVTTPIGASSDEARAVAIDSQGRIVAAGSTLNTPSQNFALARYDANGILDTTLFGGGTGKVTTGFGSPSDAIVNAIAIDSQDRIVAAGSAFNGANDDFAIARYNANGTLDMAQFGAGTGKVTTAFGTGDDQARGVAIDSQGRIVVAGQADNGSNDDFALIRLNANGTPDTGFGPGGTGKVTTPIGIGDDAGLAVAIDSQGRIVVAGRSFNGTDGDFAVVRYKPDGTLDGTFNGTGRVTTPFVAGGFDTAFAVAIDSQDRIVAVGRNFNGTNNDFALARYNTNGTLDTTFNGTGKVTTPISSGDDAAFGTGIDSQGRIVAVGQTDNPGAGIAVLRYLADGTLDNAFNGSGKVTTSVGTGDAVRGVAIDSQDRIVEAGAANADFQLVRLIGDQTPPAVSIDSGPAEGSVTNDATPDFAFSSPDAFFFQCGFDGFTAVCSSPFTPAVALSEGQHTYSLTGTDRAGNTSAPTTRTFTVDTRAPDLAIKGKGKVRTKRKRARDRLRLKTDEPATFTCKVDKRKAKACGIHFRTPKLKLGKHKVKVKATDLAGNSASEVKKVRIVRKRA